MVDQLVQDFSLLHPEKSVPGLVGVYKAIGQLKDGYWKTQKLKEVQQLIEACSGLWLEAVVRGPYAVQGDSLSVGIVVNNRLGSPIAVRGVSVDGFDTAWRQQLEGDRNYSFLHNIYVSPRHPVTQPYWLAEPMSPGSFNVKDQQLIGNPLSAPAYEVKFRLDVGGEEMVFTRPVLYKYTDAVKGELYQPLTILPPATASFDPGLVLFTDKEHKSFWVEATDHTGRGKLPAMQLTPHAGRGGKGERGLYCRRIFVAGAAPQRYRGDRDGESAGRQGHRHWR
ncbi:hypothetical protein ACQ86N_11215 [Puia sp. P3]|uniref:hypothetical protein n=1 Tax=Puia sp. P3 TaxID=3423952 RepID=UPI003D673158